MNIVIKVNVLSGVVVVYMKKKTLGTITPSVSINRNTIQFRPRLLIVLYIVVILAFLLMMGCMTPPRRK